MNLYESFVIAFSMYSRIPMPRAEWSREGMKYALCFFPFVGLVLGALMWGACLFMDWAGVSQLAKAAVLTVLPVAVTGGIHVDGLIDTCDALHSWQPREKKLEILKDPHVGAFGIIGVMVYGLLMLGAMGEMSGRHMAVYGGGLFLSRTLSGLSVVLFPCAKDSGLAASFADGAAQKTARTVFCVYLAAAAAYLWALGQWAGLLALAGALAVFAHYYRMSGKQFGGITGDLAGYFLCVCETVMAICLAAAGYLGWIR